MKTGKCNKEETEESERQNSGEIHTRKMEITHKGKREK